MWPVDTPQGDLESSPISVRARTITRDLTHRHPNPDAQAGPPQHAQGAPLDHAMASYYNALIGGLDAPEVVVDAFHIVRLGNTVVDEVRRRVQQETLGHRGFKGDPLYGIRRTLLTGAERLTEHGRARLAAGLDAGDPDAEVWYTHPGQLSGPRGRVKWAGPAGGGGGDGRGCR